MPSLARSVVAMAWTSPASLSKTLAISDAQILRNQFAHVHAQRLGFAPAIHSHRPGVPGQDAAFQVLTVMASCASRTTTARRRKLVGLRKASRVCTVSVMSKKEITAPSMTLSSVR
jgi:hypothetical protein